MVARRQKGISFKINGLEAQLFYLVIFSLFPLALVITQYFPLKFVISRYLCLQVGTNLAQKYGSSTMCRCQKDALRKDYNENSPHSSLGNISPVEYAKQKRPVEPAVIQFSETIKNDLQ